MCFADLVEFTKLGEHLPIEELGALTGRLGELAREVASPPVQLVKLIGDAAMLVSPETDPLLECALCARRGGRARRARASRCCAPASRTARRCRAAATGTGTPSTSPAGSPTLRGRRACSATNEVRDAAGDGFSWSNAGRRSLKGVSGRVGLVAGAPRRRRPGGPLERRERPPPRRARPSEPPRPCSPTTRPRSPSPPSGRGRRARAEPRRRSSSRRVGCSRSARRRSSARRPSRAR